MARGNALTRQETEDSIHELMQRIYEVYKQYNPNGSYLSLTINHKYMSMNNVYYGNDIDHPINASWVGEERLRL